MVDRYIATFYPTQYLKRFPEGCYAGLCFLIMFREAVEKLNAPHAVLLRARDQRHRRCAAECRDEFPPPHARPQGSGMISLPGQSNVLKGPEQSLSWCSDKPVAPDQEYNWGRNHQRSNHRPGGINMSQ